MERALHTVVSARDRRSSWSTVRSPIGRSIRQQSWLPHFLHHNSACTHTTGGGGVKVATRSHIRLSGRRTISKPSSLAMPMERRTFSAGHLGLSSRLTQQRTGCRSRQERGLSPPPLALGGRER